MCTWNPVSDEALKSRRKRGERKHHYTWDLDDGRPGFVRHTKKDRLKIYVDVDGDGLFTANDKLVGRARINKPYRSLGRGEILEAETFGAITAFNALDASSADTHAVRDAALFCFNMLAFVDGDLFGSAQVRPLWGCCSRTNAELV